MTLELLRAVYRGDVGTFDALVTATDITEVTERERWNLLHRALMTPTSLLTEAMLRHLVALGVDIAARDAWRNTPLFYAARVRRTDLVAVLLDAGAPPDPVNDEGVTPLRQTLLVRPVDVASLRLLVAAGADPQHRTGDGSSVAELARLTVAEDEVLSVLGA